MRFRLSLLGILGGVACAGGTVGLLQQFGLVYPTLTVVAGALTAGALSGVVLPTLARTSRRRRRRRPVGGGAAAAPPVVSVPAAEDADAPLAVAPVGDVGPVDDGGGRSGGSGEAWRPTHAVPAGGLAAWAAPDPTEAPIARLEARVELVVVETAGEWAKVVGSNGWTGWVDARRLVVR